MEELKEDKLLKILKWLFVIISILHVVYATITMRGLYEDGAFCMLDQLNRFSLGIYLPTIDTEHPRFFILALLQLPIILANALFSVSDKKTLMMIFSCSHFLLPLIALYWNYILAKRTKRPDIFFFCLLTYCAVFITFSIFSLVESLLGGIFHFILMNYLVSDIKYTKKDIFCISFLVIVMFATYEYVVLLGIIFFIASLGYIKKASSVKQKIVKSIIGAGALLASIFNLIYMFCVPGEKNEILRFSGEMIDFFPYLLHLNSIFSITAFVLIFLCAFYNNRFSKWIILLISLINIALFYYLISNPLLSVFPMWEQHLRTVPCWFLPIIFVVMFALDYFNVHYNDIKLRNLISIVLICGIFQTSWQMVNSYYWDKNIQYMKKELAASPDLLYIPSDHEEISGFANEKLRRYIWHSIYAATSILFSDEYEQKTLLLHYDNNQDPGNLTFRHRLYVVNYMPNTISIPFGTFVQIKNNYWDLTKCAEALDKYNKEHNIKTDLDDD